MSGLLGAGLWALARLPDSTLEFGARAIFSKSWRRFNEATADPGAAQTERLLRLVTREQDTDFGRSHGFSKIRNFDDYRARVPVRNYDEFAPYIERMRLGEESVLTKEPPFFFGLSSGTTGARKYIPVTRAFVDEYKRPRRVFSRQLVQAFPGLVRGNILGMHSPKIEGHTEGGVPVGSITVALSGERSPLDAAPRAVFSLEDFQLKYYAVLRFAAQSKITLAAAVNPSTLVLLVQKLTEHAERLCLDLREGRLDGIERMPPDIRSVLARALKKDAAAADRIEASMKAHGRVMPPALWPELLGLLCWKGGSAPFYLEQLHTAFPGLPIMDYGYLATEGGFSIPLSTEGAKGVVAVTGHVLEFSPEDEPLDPSRTLLADALEPGARYRVIVSGAHGLYRYDIQDVVECVGRYQQTAEIAFVQKSGNMLSITGEKVGEAHVIEAIERLKQKVQIELRGFSVCCELADPPRYLLGVELGEGPLHTSTILRAFDGALREVNLEYDAKRRSQRLGSPELLILRPGAFEDERRRRVEQGAFEGHVKTPHLSRDLALFERLGVQGRYKDVEDV